MIWEMKPHTKAKHVVLKNYLQAWFPIMALTFPKILYIDGFAGPGRYTKGEDGSPIIALKIAIDSFHSHYEKLKNKEFIFKFIEDDKESSQSLDSEIKALSLPKNFKIELDNDTFENVMHKLFQEKQTLEPTFAFIDPFGTKGVPFDVVKQIMSYPSCEVFINHMYFGVIRSEHTTDHTQLYGTDKWKYLMDLPGKEKHESLTNLYANQLRKKASVKYVRNFNIRNKKNATLFDLIYATNNLTGLEKMKIAMWKADPLGNFTFRDTTNPYQLVLFEPEPEFDILKDNLLNTFRGKTVEITDIEHHVLINTPFLVKDIRSKALIPMEKNFMIKVQRPGNHGFPKGTKISFL